MPPKIPPPKLISKVPLKKVPAQSLPREVSRESSDSDLERAIEESLARVQSTVGTTAATRAWLDHDYTDGAEEIIPEKPRFFSSMKESTIQERMEAEDPRVQKLVSIDSASPTIMPAQNRSRELMFQASVERLPTERSPQPVGHPVGAAGSSLRYVADVSIDTSVREEKPKTRSIGVSTSRSPEVDRRLIDEPTYLYPAPQAYCDGCGIPHVSTRLHRHLSVGLNGSGTFGCDYLVDQYDPTLTNIDYEYGISTPGKEVKIIKREECCGGLIPCFGWDEYYTGRIVGHEWPYLGHPPPPVWSPVVKLPSTGRLLATPGVHNLLHRISLMEGSTINWMPYSGPLDASLGVSQGLEEDSRDRSLHDIGETLRLERHKKMHDPFTSLNSDLQTEIGTQYSGGRGLNQRLVKTEPSVTDRREYTNFSQLESDGQHRQTISTKFSSPKKPKTEVRFNKSNVRARSKHHTSHHSRHPRGAEAVLEGEDSECLRRRLPALLRLQESKPMSHTSNRDYMKSGHQETKRHIPHTYDSFKTTETMLTLDETDRLQKPSSHLKSGKKDGPPDRPNCFERPWIKRRRSFGENIFVIANVVQELLDGEIKMDENLVVLSKDRQRRRQRRQQHHKQSFKYLGFDNEMLHSPIVTTSSMIDYLPTFSYSNFACDGIGDEPPRSRTNFENLLGGYLIVGIVILCTLLLVIFIGASISMIIVNPAVIFENPVSVKFTSAPAKNEPLLPDLRFSIFRNYGIINSSECLTLDYIEINFKYSSSFKLPLSIYKLRILMFLDQSDSPDKNLLPISENSKYKDVRTGDVSTYFSDYINCYWFENPNNDDLVNQFGYERKTSLLASQEKATINSESIMHLEIPRLPSEDLNFDSLDTLYFLGEIPIQTDHQLKHGDNILTLSFPFCIMNKDSLEVFQRACLTGKKFQLVFHLPRFYGLAWAIQVPIAGWILVSKEVDCPNDIAKER